MGVRKQQAADARKEARKSLYLARLNNCPTSPRKMRLVADMIRGTEVMEASSILQFSKKEAARRMEKLLWSAISNYEQKSGEKWESGNLFVKEVMVDSARILKRIQPAPQGRAHRINKRSNHVTLVLGSLNDEFIEDIQAEEIDS
ncbi:MAG: 50S ribosomal protein L22 [Salibacteraceae bacterium]